MLKSIVRWDGHSPRTCVCELRWDGHSPRIVCLSEMVIPHIVYDGMVIPHVIKKILVEDLRWDGHSPRRDSVVYVHPVAVYVVP